jgi:hypothetical protein
MFKAKNRFADAVVMGDEAIMAPKAHGTSNVPVQSKLRWGCDTDTADRICNFNRHYAEHSGYFEKTSFVKDASATSGEINFYDSNTGKLLFTAPKERTMEEFLVESRAHGWPSFRGKWFNEEKKSCLAFVRRFLELNLIINYVLCTLRRRSKLGVCSLFAEWRSGECGRNPSRTQPA